MADSQEQCIEYNGEQFHVPHSLLEQERVFSHVMSRDTWENLLTESDRQELIKCLPQGLTHEQRNETISKLFDGSLQQFGDPLTNTWNKLASGMFCADIDPLKQEIEQLQYHLYKQHVQLYHMKLVQDILLCKRQLINSAFDNGSLDNLEPLQATPTKTTPTIRQNKRKSILKRAETKYRKLLKECSKESNIEISSDEEATPTEEVLTEREYFKMLRHHKKKRRMRKMDPDLDTRGITLSSISDISHTPINSTPLITIKSEPTVTTPTITKPLPKTPPKLIPKSTPPPLTTNTNTSKLILQSPAIIKDTREWEGLFYGPGCIYEVYSDSERLKGDSLAPIIIDGPLPTGQFLSFFSLVKKSFEGLLDHKGDLTKVMEMVQIYVDSPESQSCSWLSSRSDWTELTLSALCYLGGEVGAVSSFDPLPHYYPVLEFKDRIDHWRWIGNNRDSDVELLVLCNHWLANINRALVVVDFTDYTPLPPLISTSANVKPSKPHETERFRQLELERYSQPHKAFTYKVHGYEATVGPVKGAKTVIKKDHHGSRARGHALLKQERPNCITILSLVRDACSRLPNGEGTRLDLCILLRDSQFVSDNVTDGQLNNAVSGALDRLHYEKDPCVRYISSKKIWLYLHRHRTQEEFEHISWAVEASNKNKKIIHTRAKHIPKILLRETSGQLLDISPPRDALKTSSNNFIKSLHRSPRNTNNNTSTTSGGARGGSGRGGRGKQKPGGRKGTKTIINTTTTQPTATIESDNDSNELPFLPTTTSKSYELNINSDSNSDDEPNTRSLSYVPPPRLISNANTSSTVWNQSSEDSD